MTLAQAARFRTVNRRADGWIRLARPQEVHAHHGTHICQRAAIARSSDGGTQGPAEGRGAQGSIVIRMLSLCRIIVAYVSQRHAVAMAHSCVDAARAFLRNNSESWGNYFRLAAIQRGAWPLLSTALNSRLF